MRSLKGVNIHVHLGVSFAGPRPVQAIFIVASVVLDEHGFRMGERPGLGWYVAEG